MAMSKEERIAKVLELIASGTSTRKACKKAGIAMTTFLENVGGDQYTRAREAQADTHFDEMAELEADCLAGKLDAQAFRAAMDSRKWRLARMRPRVYGDKLDVTSSDGSIRPLPQAVEIILVDAKNGKRKI